MSEIITRPTVLHPLHPITAAEISIAVELIFAEKKLSPARTRFVSVSLKEPSKASVYAFKPGDTFNRAAFVVVLDNASGLVYEAVISFAEVRIISWQNIYGVQPTMTSDEQVECEELVKND